MKKLAILSVALVGWTGILHAEEAKEIKSGLWEIQHKTAVDGQKMPDMNEMMAQVPPEMRGQMQAMMAKQGAGMTSKGVTICITPEQAAGQNYGADDQDGKCKITDMQHDGDITHMKMACSDPKGEGETTVTRQNSEAWSSVTHMTMEQDGQQHSMSSESHAKWLGADCGAVQTAGKSTGKKAKTTH